jgi:transcriptional regulator with GAF, ATPase, and Fis domain
VGATGAVELARDAEARLAAHVPDDARAHFADRLERRELFGVEALVASSFDRGRTSRARTASLPPTSALPPDTAPSRADAWRVRYPELVGRSAPITQILSLLDRVAPSEAIVLIRGESGTGKELVAEALHRHSPRRDRPFVKVNCAALVETLLLSELFGHERGAFTGASARRKGRFEVADGGTLFLDEIGDMPLAIQSKLLRVLQDGTFSRVGGNQTISTDVRIVAATNKNLEEEVAAKKFREDLFYRLNVVRLHLPPLRNRREDVRLLAEYFLKRIAARTLKPQLQLSQEAVEVLENYPWPGNVRELENTIQRAAVLATADVLLPKDLPLGQPAATQVAAPSDNATAVSADNLEDAAALLFAVATATPGMKLLPWVEQDFTRRAMEHTGQNQVRAAKLLGITRATLRKRLEHLRSAAL